MVVDLIIHMYAFALLVHGWHIWGLNVNTKVDTVGCATLKE